MVGSRRKGENDDGTSRRHQISRTTQVRREVRVLRRNKQRKPRGRKPWERGFLPLFVSFPVADSADLVQLADGLLVGALAVLHLLHKRFGIVFINPEIIPADLSAAPLTLSLIQARVERY